MPKSTFYSPGQDAPIIELAVITASDTVDLPFVSRGLYVGTGGNINLMAADNASPVLMKDVPQGATLPIRVKRILSTSTTASDLIALY